MPVEVLPNRTEQHKRCNAQGETMESRMLRSAGEAEQFLEALVASWQAKPLGIVTSRRAHRVGYAWPVVLTPMDDAGRRTVGEPLQALGNDLSVDGVSFVHHRPLPYRHVAVTFDLGNGRSESVVTRLTWCRFTCEGLYRSGGRFLRKTAIDCTPPKEDLADA